MKTRYECTHPSCDCKSKDDCMAEKKNVNQNIIEMKKQLNGENKD